MNCDQNTLILVLTINAIIVCEVHNCFLNIRQRACVTQSDCQDKFINKILADESFNRKSSGDGVGD